MSSEVMVDGAALREEVRKKYREVATDPHGDQLACLDPKGRIESAYQLKRVARTQDPWTWYQGALAHTSMLQ